MNVDQANNLDFPYLLSRLGFEPVATKKGGNEYWYQSPFRAEKEPSFHISKGHTYNWVWKDFGDEGGTLVDFVMRYEGHRSFKRALATLRDIFGTGKSIQPTKATNPSHFFSFHRQAAQPPKISEPVEEPKRELRFIRAVPIQNPAIMRYLTQQRCIPRHLIEQHLEEVHYKNEKTGKNFFAFGMKNNSGGYEIRAASDQYDFKSALMARDITLVKGCDPKRGSINIVEGMTDFLSLLEMFKTRQLAGDTLILHSLSSYDRAVEHIKEQGYSAIHTFLDNDAAGEKGTAAFKAEFRDLCHAQNHLYLPQSDLNDWLKAQTRQRTSSIQR